MAKLTLQELESKLWQCADILRGELTGAEYKDYIFGMLFLKRINDEFDEEKEARKKEFTEDGLDKEEIQELLEDSSIYESFFVPEQARWSKLKDLTLNIGPELDKAFKAIEDEPKNSELIGVLSTTNYNDKEKVPDKKLSQLLILFSTINLANSNLESDDMLGDAYQYLIKQFADQGGKKGGEFYTPTEVVKVLVNILKPEEGDRIYDPTCGSGGMLIQSIEYVKKHGGNPKNLSLFGQEINLSTWAICKMNMLFHGAKGADIQKGDTIRDPKHTEGGALKVFDKVLANPPFSLKNWGVEEAESDAFHRFNYGIPPKSYGDLAFVEHMLSSLNMKGKMASVVPHGVLFRGSAEGKIRAGFINDDLIEAVIGIPQNIFYGTGIPAAILVLNKAKAEERKGKVLFIDGSNDFGKEKVKNVLRNEDIEKIVNTFSNFKDVEKYASIVDIETIKENDCNLNISRYVDTTEEEEQVDIQRVLGEIAELEKKEAETKNKLSEYLKELGFDVL
ncbi:type I restriction-modification system subunit M [Clostridium sp. C8]|uniref:type I restriction-modification system subunit M n=1 Tax=Clostridium sp. C8 TaxID=1667357 RepID=UPI00062E5DF1|nr:type I restriction-modification system subunit M [Clostridium sp. C8]KLE17140.1 type I restriction-modification protein subunit M [Clostridium sp. C8]